VEGRLLDERELVERARGGDVDAYEELVRRFQDVAGRTARIVLGGGGGSADAQDAVQDAFVKAYYALDRFRPGAAFRPWLLRIVANEAINRRRAAGRQVALALRAARTVDAAGLGGGRAAAGGRLPGDAGSSPEEAALEQERQRELLDSVAALRPEDRLVIAYRFWFELSEAEMAQALGCARGTVKSRLSRALGRLRRILEQGGGAADA
jgi:RNA polymerase sigma-70 factor (ECF subfamily)